MLTEMDAVDQEPDQVERLERGGLPRRQLRRGLRPEAATHGTLARAAALHRRRHWFQASRGDADSIWPTTRRFNRSTAAIPWKLG